MTPWLSLTVTVVFASIDGGAVASVPADSVAVVRFVPNIVAIESGAIGPGRRLVLDALISAGA